MSTSKSWKSQAFLAVTALVIGDFHSPKDFTDFLDMLKSKF